MKPETATFERKRTANLESLIGNLKVRKMSETPKQHKLHSLYVEVSGSDCSRSTPPLSSSSPSVSPSSMSPDSPLQSNVSSSLSSISSSSLATASNSSKSRSLLPKYRWMSESSPRPHAFKDGPECASLAAQLCPAPSPAKKAKGAKKSESAKSAAAKANEDPSRAIKFYDDHIDFRGDILRRPPNSKNCRILWEYLFLLLSNPSYSSVIKWEDDTKMIFRIVQAEKLAALWGLQKNRLGMTYEKLSRGMRYYYPNNIIAREPGRRLLYRFMRHPDEIKKFVKKNGTYMLKKTKQTCKKDEASLDDSGVDEPSRIKSEQMEHELVDDEAELDSHAADSVHSDKIVDSNKNSPLGALGHNPVQFYSDLYQYMYQAQMAAAAQMNLPGQFLLRGQSEQNLNEPMMKQLVSLLAQQQGFNLNKFKNGASDSSSFSSSSSTHSFESESNLNELAHPLNLTTGL
ncbi:Transcription factor ETV6, partial [Brachionus plicatilis]